LLSNGKVLIAAGNNPSIDDQIGLTSAELFDPATNTWSSAGNLTDKRELHAAALLPNGKVLVTGGFTTSAAVSVIKSCELYDPASNSWSFAGSLNTARYYHSVTVLPNGKVLAAAGYTGLASIKNSELYDPATDTWTPAGDLSQVRCLHTATLL